MLSAASRWSCHQSDGALARGLKIPRSDPTACHFEKSSSAGPHVKGAESYQYQSSNFAGEARSSSSSSSSTSVWRKSMGGGRFLTFGQRASGSAQTPTEFKSASQPSGTRYLARNLSKREAESWAVASCRVTQPGPRRAVPF